MSHAGQIGLVSASKWSFWSWIIQVVTRSRFNHVIIGIGLVDGVESCIGAEPGGAKVRPVSFFDTEIVVWSDFKLGEKRRKKIVAWVKEREGRPYSYVTDLAIGLALILPGSIPKWLAAYLSSDYIYECAQLGQAAYLAAGIDLFDGKLLPGECFPGSFTAVFEKNGWL